MIVDDDSQRRLMSVTSTCRQSKIALQSATTNNNNNDDDDWVDLTPNGGVRKRILEAGDDTTSTATQGETVAIEYVGTLRDLQASWTVQDVVDCWLSEQQGLEGLADAFLEHEVDGALLMNPEAFTEDFVSTNLGVANKIQCKKLVMAAKRLTKEPYNAGSIFDTSAERGRPFQFTVGQKAIRAIQIAVQTMRMGERAEIVARSDYAYGKEGYRKANGDVMVPPFAVLCFDITRVPPILDEDE